MRLEELVIPIKTDTSGFDGGMKNATKMITNFAKVAAVAVAAAAVVVGKFLIDSTKLASDLAETVSKVGIVFGDSAKDIMKWAKTAATSLGMSKNAALAAAGTFGNLFRAMKIGEKESADMSMGLVNLAADLASFNNMNPTEVLDKLRAGLSGETEPLRSLGVNLNQAMIEAKALELGLWDGVDAIDASAKAQASYALILEQTILAQGDFERTSEGLANQQRILAAQWEDMKTTLGTAFLPLFTKAVTKLNEFVKILADPEGVDVGKIVAWADENIGAFIGGLGDSVDNWVSSGGPEELSNKIISWVENIGSDSESKSKILAGAQKLATAIGDALGDIDWAGIAATIDNKIAETINDHDWTASGDAFGDAIENWFSKAVEAANADPVVLPQATLLVNGTTAYFQTSETGQALGNAIKGWFAGAIGPDALAGFNRLGPLITEKLNGWGQSFKTWRDGVNATMAGWSSNVNSTVSTALNTLKTTIENKLTDIAKTFFNRAAGWGAQMLLGFTGSQGSLFSAISGMVAEINGLLRKIITSFHLTITFSEPTAGSGSMGGGAGGGNSGPGAGGGSTGGGSTGGGGNRRASGGPVIGGSSYSVAEFFRPERFTPNVSGRIDPIQSQAVVATIDEARLARVIVQALMQAGFSG